ncbi:hypothetical protein L484_022684 [Morus notabilis]|uniref:Pentacotripeptide-repeat region of PRORP domain-containing protein n=1 Tax=Morus notabilis TaxID=981085 RepID=W9RKV6_9ROSA|nr:pentatricopeptide repeat-containing protein At4g38150 [Morus notabilis]EXB57577.1 hypothetical protein L484_022684 [Morus notabilis]
MAMTTRISRAFPIFSDSFSFSILFCKRFLRRPPPLPSYTHATTTFSFSSFSSSSSSSFLSNRLFSSSSDAPKKINTKVNFSLPSDDETEDENDNKKAPKDIDKSKLPPPYDPFSKKPAVEEPDDPKDLQEIFHKMSSDGLLNNAVKMFDGLSKDGLTHAALELFAQIKDKGEMPDVVAHTAVIEAYANAGQTKEALKVFLRMLASGVAPNTYTYAVLIKGLAANPKFLGDAKKHVLEMMSKGMRPNASVYAAVFEAFARERKEEEAREFLVQIRERGFVPVEKAVREAMKDKRGPVFRSVMSILFGK